jgi:transcriptional regulator with XRE-family HTH domain
MAKQLARAPKTPVRPQRRPTFIREWRKYRGKTLEQLATDIEMTAGHLSMLERGQRAYTQDTLEKIAKALQTDAAALLSLNPLKPEAIWSWLGTFGQLYPGPR